MTQNDERDNAGGGICWFFDVMGFGGIECYSAKHPMNNTSSINERRKAFAVLADNNLISGTEEGSEFYIGC